MSRMMSGSPILMGDNTVPGVKMHKEVKAVVNKIFSECRDFGLDFYPTVVEFLTYDEISEIAAYGGFPVRYPHWRFGMEFEELSRGYEFGLHRISEMVINTSPSYIYCLDSNTLCDNIDVIAHALGHNDFFKNNVFFSATNTGMLNKMANHGMRIRKYMARWGKENVTAFIDQVLRIETLIDSSKAWKEKTIKDVVIRDERKYHETKRLHPEHFYMDSWVNSPERVAAEKERVKKKELHDHLELFGGPDRDVLGYLKNHAPLKPWQQDVIAMLYEEAMYFAPQRATKTINEGWASFVDYNIMCRRGLCSLGQEHEGGGIIEYAKHKMLVLGGKYSQNPYKTGYELLMDIEERWNKGRFGTEYENCTNMQERANWDTKTGLGMEKVFEVRKHYNDVLLISEFFTQEFCDKNEYYEYQWFPNGEKKIISKDFKTIKKKLLQKYSNGGLPDICLVDPNHRGVGHFLLQHNHIGMPLYQPYVADTLTALYSIWQNTIVLATKNDENEEVVWVCSGRSGNDVVCVSRNQYDDGKYNTSAYI